MQAQQLTAIVQAQHLTSTVQEQNLPATVQEQNLPATVQTQQLTATMQAKLLTATMQAQLLTTIRSTSSRGTPPNRKPLRHSPSQPPGTRSQSYQKHFLTGHNLSQPSHRQTSSQLPGTLLTATRSISSPRTIPHSHHSDTVLLLTARVPCRYTFSHVPGPLPHSHQDNFLTGPATVKENTSPQLSGTPSTAVLID
jgi:hypothetical protein